MKRFPKLLALILSLTMVICFMAGCGSNQQADPEPQDTSVTFTDQLGREVTLDAPAERIIGTHNPSVNMAIVLDGNAKRIVGFGNKDMAYGLLEIVAPEIDEIVQIGKGKNINMETVVSVDPDIMLLPKRHKQFIEEFEKLDVPVLVLDVEKFDSIKEALTLVGKAIGRDDRAAQIVDFFDKKIEATTKVAEAAETKPTVLMLSGSSMTGVSTDSMLQNQMIETAGGVSVTKGFNAEELWPEVNLEQIVAWNPDIIYVPAYADYTVEDVLKAEGWSNISAVKNGKVYRFPSSMEPWDYPTASACLGLCWTTYNLHPELYSFEDLMKDADEFYNLVYGQTFTPEQLGIEK